MTENDFNLILQRLTDLESRVQAIENKNVLDDGLDAIVNVRNGIFSGVSSVLSKASDALKPDGK